MISRIAVEGFRSIRSLVLDLAPLTVITGGNGVGKTNVYRALGLLADCGSSRMIGSLARMGGLSAVRHAGERRQRDPVALKLGFAGDELGYAIDIGLPTPSDSAFQFDPEIKQEHVFVGDSPRPTATLLRRQGRSVMADGAHLQQNLSLWHSVLEEQAGNDQVPEAAGVRRLLRSWRFYDSLRTDADAPARRPQVATRAFTLDADGGNLAAVLQSTIENGGDAEMALRAISDAFRGSRLVTVGDAQSFTVALHQPSMLRPLTAAELSEGTLQFLLLTAALTSVEKPGLLVLNEPERSLHTSLMPALAALIKHASAETQIVVVTHHPVLVEELGAATVELCKSSGATQVLGREGALDQPVWAWPKR